MLSDPFVIRCSRKFFSKAEIRVLEEHGKRLEALADGRQLPASEAGRRFVEAVNGVRKPETAYERIWLKYQWRLEWEQDPANRVAMGPPRKMHDDREDWRRMRSANWGLYRNDWV